MMVADSIVDRIEVIAPLRLATAAGETYSYRERGDLAAPVLVLLHGIGSASGSWVHQLVGLSERFRVIAWDSPGYGGSTPLSMPAPKASDYAAALGRFLTALGTDPSVLVGHSLGALMACAFAVENERDLKALILADPANGYGAADPELRESKLSARLRNMDELGPDGLARARAAALLSDEASAEALDLVQWNMSRLDPKGHEPAARMLALGNLIADAARYKGRVLVMCGSADTVTPEAGCRAVAAAFPGAVYRTLPGVGHASYVENPAQFNAAVVAFVEASV